MSTRTRGRGRAQPVVQSSDQPEVSTSSATNEPIPAHQTRRRHAMEAEVVHTLAQSTNEVSQHGMRTRGPEHRNSSQAVREGMHQLHFVDALLTGSTSQP
jgi:aspartate aminotransferase-like enzyme